MAKLQKIFKINKLNLKIMYQLVTIRQNLDEKQFTQLAENLTNGRFVVSAFFRCINKFQCKEYKTYEEAVKFYELVK